MRTRVEEVIDWSIVALIFGVLLAYGVNGMMKAFQ